MKKFGIITGLLLFAPGAPAAETITLPQALSGARTNALELRTFDSEQERARAQAGSLEQAWDPVVYANTFWTRDNSENQSLFAGDWQDRMQAEVGVRKIFPTATVLDSSLTHQRDFTEFPDQQVQPGQPPTQPDPSAFQSFNPAYTTRLNLTVRQPVVRNWAGRELELQQRIAESGIATPELDRRVQEQMVQADTEQVYWNIAEWDARISLTTELIDASTRFAELMKKRTRFGRADQVDVASAEASVVAREGQRLDMIFSAEHMRRRLRIRMDPDGPLPSDLLAPTPVTLPERILERQPLPLPVSTAAEAYEYALSNRADLALIEQRMEPLHARRDLAREQGKPNVFLTGQLGTTGLEKFSESSLVDAVDDAKHLTYGLGLEAEFTIGKTASKSEDAAAVAETAILEARRTEILANVRNEIEYAFTAFDAAARKLAQAERNIAVLQAKRDAEFEKFRQARSEEIVVLSYEIEVMSARYERIAALKMQRDGEVRLRAAIHGYPAEAAE